MKKKILETLIQEQQQVIDDLKTTINERKVASDLDEDMTLDLEDYSHQEEQSDMELRMRSQLLAANIELNAFKKYRRSKNSTVSPGALIEVNDAYYFVGGAVHNIPYGDKTIICISEKAPVFRINEGKTAGQMLKLGNHGKKIVSIH